MKTVEEDNRVGSVEGLFKEKYIVKDGDSYFVGF